ncbi:MAG: MCE family protein [Alphaproteobacteria bacterium]|nr:MCE family protein [Alphaproteobacteria bacterium]
METRAHNVLIGAFVLAFVAAMFVFVAWLARTHGDEKLALYDIVFTDAVSGLAVGGDVRFNGIKVGAVRRIAIDHESPSRVRVTVELGHDVPIRQDSTATMQLQGITGVTYVQISGGTQASPRIEPAETPPYPVIPSRPSQIAELVDQLPKLIERSTSLVDRGNALMDDDNRRNLAAALADLRQITQAMAGRADALTKAIDELAAASGGIGELVRRSNRVAEELSATMSVARGALAGADQLMDTEIRETVAAIGRVAKDASRLLGDNRDSLDSFATDGLVEFRRFIEEARVLVQNLGRVATKIEEDPRQVIFGSQESETRLESERR